MAKVNLLKKIVDGYLKRGVLAEDTYGLVYKSIDAKVKSYLFFKLIELFIN